MTRAALLLVLVLGLIGPVRAQGSGQQGSQDAKAYCAAVRDDDRVKPIPAALVSEAARALEMDDTDWVKRSTVFRCMDGSVWVCNHGANIPCSKANTSRVSKAVTAYCKKNPGSDVVPMVVTGHDTVHEWRCVGSKPQIVHSEPVDARGFIADQWIRLSL